MKILILSGSRWIVEVLCICIRTCRICGHARVHGASLAPIAAQARPSTTVATVSWRRPRPSGGHAMDVMSWCFQISVARAEAGPGADTATSFVLSHPIGVLDVD